MQEVAPLSPALVAQAPQDGGWPRALTDATTRPPNRRKQLVHRTQRPDVHVAARRQDAPEARANLVERPLLVPVNDDDDEHCAGACMAPLTKT